MIVRMFMSGYVNYGRYFLQLNYIDYMKVPHMHYRCIEFLRELGFRDFSLMEEFLVLGKIGSLKMEDFSHMPVLQPGVYDESMKDTEIGEKNKSEEDSEFEYFITQDEIDALLEVDYISKKRGCNFSIEYSKWNCMKTIVSWMLENRGEEITQRHLINYTKSEPSIWLDDLSRIIRMNFTDLPNNILKMILDNGYTREVYDAIVKEYVRPKYVGR